MACAPLTGGRCAGGSPAEKMWPGARDIRPARVAAPARVRPRTWAIDSPGPMVLTEGDDRPAGPPPVTGAVHSRWAPRSHPSRWEAPNHLSESSQVVAFVIDT